MGRMDAFCTPEALSAASALGHTLMLPEHSHLFTSPLQRCLGTAEAVFSGRVAQIDARLTERDLGKWGGCSKKLLRVACPEAFLPSGRLDPYFTPPSGESLIDFCQRVAAFLKMVATMGSDNATIVVVSHNGVIRLTRYLLEGLPIEQLFAEGEPHLAPSTFICDPLSDPFFESRVMQICGRS